MSATAGRGGRVIVRVLVSVGLLALLAWWLDMGDVLSRLASLRAPWVAGAIAVSLGQVALSAWRWSFTAGRLGLRLSWGVAVREYYLAMFLNQLVPGGVVGDVTRAWRHARLEDTGAGHQGGRLRTGVRTAGDVGGHRPVARPCAPAVPPAVAHRGGAGLRPPRSGDRRGGVGGSASGRGVWPAAGATWRDARRALFSAPALPWQVGSSCLVVATYIVTYVMAARAVGLDAPVWVIGPLVPPVLMSMVVPVSVAGWGIREGTAALVWGVAGLTVADGVAVSVAYGLIVFVSALPGAFVLLFSHGGPGPAPSGPAGQEVADPTGSSASDRDPRRPRTDSATPCRRRAPDQVPGRLRRWSRGRRGRDRAAGNGRAGRVLAPELHQGRDCDGRQRVGVELMCSRTARWRGRRRRARWSVW